MVTICTSKSDLVSLFTIFYVCILLGFKNQYHITATTTSEGTTQGIGVWNYSGEGVGSLGYSLKSSIAGINGERSERKNVAVSNVVEIRLRFLAIHIYD